MKIKLALLTFTLLVCLHAPEIPGQLQPPLTGSTPGQSLRNAATATYNQVAGLRNVVDNWSRRAGAGIYTDAYFQHDYATAQGRFVALRTQFNYLAALALQLRRPGADNAVAELDAGLNIIGELFVFLEERYKAGTLDRSTVARTTHVFQKALRVWESELRRNGSRLGPIW